jgi:hypothetical protein
LRQRGSSVQRSGPRNDSAIAPFAQARPDGIGNAITSP